MGGYEWEITEQTVSHLQTEQYWLSTSYGGAGEGVGDELRNTDRQPDIQRDSANTLWQRNLPLHQWNIAS